MKKMLGSDAIMQLLKQYRVEYVLGIPGATEVLFMDALERTPEIRFLLALNEMVCVGAAEGYARATGRPLVLNMHSGPGMAAALPLLLNAKYGRVPMVILAGQNDSRLLVRDPQLSGDIVGMAKPVVKWATEIHRGTDIPVALHRAFKMATQAPMGPVVVSIPYDLLEEEIELDDRMPPATGYRPGVGSEAEIRRAGEMILRAEHPVFWVQEGIDRSDALRELVQLAETMGAAVYQGWMGDVNFPVHHPLYCGELDATGQELKQVLADSDLLIEIGGQLFNDAFYEPFSVLPEGLPIIQIDDDPWEIAKNFPVDCAIQGDIKEILHSLNASLTPDPAYQAAAKARAAVIGDRNKAAQAALAARVEAERDQTPVAVTALAAAIRDVMDADTCIVDDCWSSSRILRQVVDFKDAHTLYRPRNGGSIGFGLPGGLGVKLACPEKKVLVISGDGSAAWSMQTFWTAARYRIPVTFVITNNATYRQVKLVRKRILGDYPLTEPHLGMDIDDPTIQFQTLAASMGVKGCQVRDPAELAGALRTAMDSGAPYVVEVFLENSEK